MDERQAQILRECERFGESEVRRRLYASEYNAPRDQLLIQGWLDGKETSRRNDKEKKSLELSKEANRLAHEANDVAREANNVARLEAASAARSARWAKIAAIIAAIAAILSTTIMIISLLSDKN